MVSIQFQCGWIQSAEARFHSLALISTLAAASAGRWRIKWAWRPNYLFSHSGDSFKTGLRHDGQMWGRMHGCCLGCSWFGWLKDFGLQVCQCSTLLSCNFFFKKSKHQQKRNPKNSLILLPWRDIFSPFWMRGESCLGEFKWDPCQPYTGRINAVTLRGGDAAAHFRFCWIIQQGAKSR